MICKFMFRKLKDVLSEIYGDGDDEEEPNAMVDEVLPEISAKRFAVSQQNVCNPHFLL